MANIIVRWNPGGPAEGDHLRHYDTLPFPLMDPVNKHGRFVGANDNGDDGVALLMEGLGNEFAGKPPKAASISSLLDGEEFIFDPDAETGPDHESHRPHGQYFWGCNTLPRTMPTMRRHSAIVRPCSWTGRRGELQLTKDFNSMKWKDSAPVVDDLDHGGPAGRPRVRRPHVARSRQRRPRSPAQWGKIPACDLIDLGYMGKGKPWHTHDDTPEHCSPLSLAKVGWVLGSGSEAMSDVSSICAALLGLTSAGF